MLEIERDVSAGVIFVQMLAGLAALFTEAVVLLGLAPAVDGFLAFAPGGQGSYCSVQVKSCPRNQFPR